MELDEHWLHSRRQQVIKIIKALSESRSSLCDGVPHAKNIGNTSDLAKAIEDNLEALRIGTDDTIKMCATLADGLKQQMKEPHARKVTTHMSSSKLTPFQKRLVREGAVTITEIPTHVKPSQVEARMPKIAPFNLTKRKQKPRHSDKTYNIPR